MLVQFMLKNVLSFKEETILDMTAVNAYKEHESNLIEMDNKEKVLRVASIYGANASGKSNLHCAMDFFQRMIIESFNNVGDDELTALEKYYVPFSFENNEENTEYEIILIVDEFEYKYGYEFNAKKIVSEWMYRKSLKTNRNSIILERTEDTIEFGASVRKECEVYKKQIPSGTLALSFFNKLRLKTTIFSELYSEITEILVASDSLYEDEEMLKRFLPMIIDTNKDELVEFLKAIDTGIKDIKYKRLDKDNIEFYTTHIGRDGKKYYLPLYSESEGTIRSISIYMNARSARKLGKTIFIDELNIKLHPLLMKFIVDLFYDKESTAQLIYTTHDTTLMDKKFFRRDQIWFVQKDEFGYSELTALSDFKVRSDASFEKDYLAGVYGGIPLIKEFSLKEGE